MIYELLHIWGGDDLTLKKFALISEIVGAFAVVISLIYVALEVQQNTRAQYAAAYQEIYRDLRDNFSEIPTEIQAKFQMNEPLSPGEREDYILSLVRLMRAYENWWQQCRLGTISGEIFRTYVSHMRNTLNREQAREWWSSPLKNTTSLPGFSAYVDSYLAEHPVGSTGLGVKPMEPCQ